MTECLSAIIGADGMPLTEATLPIGSVRWTKMRKAQVAIAVRHGLITLDDACARYDTTAEEIASWQSTIDEPALRRVMINTSRRRVRRSNRDNGR